MGRPRTFDDDVVVDRAMDAFWTHGYAGTSPAQLAEATGIAKGSLYNAFGSKRELFDRALARYGELVGALAQDLLSRPGTTRDCIAGALHHIVELDLSQRRGCLVANTAAEFAGHDPDIARTVRTMQEQTVAAFAARIDQGRHDGDIDISVDARACGEVLANTLAGLRVLAMTCEAPMLHRIVDASVAGL